MKTNFTSWTRAMVLISAPFLFQACDSNAPAGKGDAEFQITSAPTEDASIKGVYVTITDIKVGGTSIPGFTKQTIDLNAYQEGNTRQLGLTQLDPKNVSTVTFVLDADVDADGNSPGCYILTANNEKFKLKKSGTIEIEVAKVWKVTSGNRSTMVLDFDIRKAIRDQVDPAVRYSFLSDANLAEALRLVNQGKAGTISGTYSDPGLNDEKIIAYAYHKGTFDASIEQQPQGEGAIRFKNAVASAEIKPGPYSLIYTLAFLEEGGYELRFAAYKLDPQSKRFVFDKMMTDQTSVGETIHRIVTVEAGEITSLNTMIVHPKESRLAGVIN